MRNIDMNGELQMKNELKIILNTTPSKTSLDSIVASVFDFQHKVTMFNPQYKI